MTGRASGEVLFEALRGLAAGVDPAPALVADSLGAEGATARLIEIAVRHAGSDETRAAIARHLLDCRWSSSFPLTCQEYGSVLGEDARIDAELSRALEDSGWVDQYRRVLCEANASADATRGAARRLLADLDSVAMEAAAVVEDIAEFGRRLPPALTVLDLQALLRAERALGRLEGMRVLEIGCGAGGLLSHLRERGARAEGIDLVPRAPGVVAGEFLDAPIAGGFDLIVAIAVFEPGSRPAGNLSSGSRHPRGALLARLFDLVKPGGVVVLENIGFPLPFSKPAAEQAGFAVVRQLVPSVNGAMGGRGCTLERRT